MRYFFVLITALILSSSLNAQVDISINYNLDTQPAWGPTGYDYVEYYYLPDIEVYYYVPQRRYHYYNNGRWRYSSRLPARFSNYDLFNSYKVVVYDWEPWKNHKSYKEKYFTYKDRRDQQLIRDSRDTKYFVNRNHPEHKKWAEQQKLDNSSNKLSSNSNKNDNGKKKEINWD